MIVLGILMIFASVMMDMKQIFMTSSVGIMGGIFFMAGLADLHSDTTPTALDVYQGKTTLEITYRNSVPVDSIVVFKDKK